MAATVAARHLSILAFLALNVHTLKGSLHQSHAVVHTHTVQDNFRLLTENPSQLSQPTHRSSFMEW